MSDSLPADKNVDISEQFKVVSLSLLDDAGGTYSLKEAASILNTNAENLQIRIDRGEILGMTHKGKTVLPILQFDHKDHCNIVTDGLKEVLDLFYHETKAGSWAALQFLATRDETLRHYPIYVLKDRNEDDPNHAPAMKAAVVHAARTYLGLNQG
ncbi:MAG: hypothetical protein WCD70_02625 [Alphaproteobacteria bacterium]